MDEQKVRDAAKVAIEIAGGVGVPEHVYREVFNAVFNSLIYDPYPLPNNRAASETVIEETLVMDNG